MRVTVPVKLLRLFRLIVEVIAVPCTKLSELGLLEMLKSGFGEAVRVTDTLALWVVVPLVPVTVTV